ncbi:MAG: histone deacetylase family protein [Myxococcota bacterium]
MVATQATAVVEDSRYLAHRGPTGHPERPDRLAAVHTAIAERASALEAQSPRAASDEEILRVHDRAYLERVGEATAQAPLQLDPDTYLCPESLAVARLAAGASIDLALRVARGELRNGFAAVRPPGHHAEARHAMGFCLFNNVALTAQALRAEAGLERILILDWDVHHGNGTQHSFEQDPDILYVSTHQFPYYPGTGAAGECGTGAGEGATVNIPLPAGCGDVEYLGAFQRILVPVARAFRPELILVSCGFDAHADDPLAAMEVTGDGYRGMARIVDALADELCGGRQVHLLEGGYALSGLEDATRALLDVLVEPESVALPETAPLEPGSELAGIIDRVGAVHARGVPGFGAP